MCSWSLSNECLVSAGLFGGAAARFVAFEEDPIVAFVVEASLFALVTGAAARACVSVREFRFHIQNSVIEILQCFAKKAFKMTSKIIQKIVIKCFKFLLKNENKIPIIRKMTQKLYSNMMNFWNKVNPFGSGLRDWSCWFSRFGIARLGTDNCRLLGRISQECIE